MSLNPVFDVCNDVTGKPYDKMMCLFCQTAVTTPKETSAKPKRGRPKKDDADDFQDFIDVCRDHINYNTGKYTALHDEIGEKTKEQLKSEGYCFHGKCRQTFDREKNIYLKKTESRRGFREGNS